MGGKQNLWPLTNFLFKEEIKIMLNNDFVANENHPCVPEANTAVRILLLQFALL